MSSTAPFHISPPSLAAFLHAKIPLSRAMAVGVAETNSTRLVLTAPLDKNLNHLGTAFGGSLHTLPTLACYTVVWMLLREAGFDGHVVIKHSEAHYRQPVTTDLRATCDRPSAAETEAFLTGIRRHKKARLELSSIIPGANGKPAVEFTGIFVALV